MIVPGFDLRSYLDHFPGLCEKKFGRAYAFHSLEESMNLSPLGVRRVAV
jgi:hypothetical protein